MKMKGFKKKSTQFKANDGYKVPETKEKEFNFKQCDYQGTREVELNKHMNMKHRVSGQNSSGTIVCRICGDQFTYKLESNDT